MKYLQPTQWAVSGTEVSLVRLGEENPVPAELVEVDGERPHTALGYLEREYSNISMF